MDERSCLLFRNAELQTELQLARAQLARANDVQAYLFHEISNKFINESRAIKKLECRLETAMKRNQRLGKRLNVCRHLRGRTSSHSRREKPRTEFNFYRNSACNSLGRNAKARSATASPDSSTHNKPKSSSLSTPLTEPDLISELSLSLIDSSPVVHQCASKPLQQIPCLRPQHNGHRYAGLAINVPRDRAFTEKIEKAAVSEPCCQQCSHMNGGPNVKSQHGTNHDSVQPSVTGTAVPNSGRCCLTVDSENLQASHIKRIRDKEDAWLIDLLPAKGQRDVIKECPAGNSRQAVGEPHQASAIITHPSIIRERRSSFIASALSSDSERGRSFQSRKNETLEVPNTCNVAPKLLAHRTTVYEDIDEARKGQSCNRRTPLVTSRSQNARTAARDFRHRARPPYGDLEGDYTRQTLPFPLDIVDLFYTPDQPDKCQRSVLISNVPTRLQVDELIQCTKVPRAKLLSAALLTTVKMRTQPPFAANTAFLVFVDHGSAVDFVRTTNAALKEPEASSDGNEASSIRATLIRSPSRPVPSWLRVELPGLNAEPTSLSNIVCLQDGCQQPRGTDARKAVVEETMSRAAHFNGLLSLRIGPDRVVVLEFANIIDAKRAHDSLYWAVARPGNYRIWFQDSTGHDKNASSNVDLPSCTATGGTDASSQVVEERAANGL